MIEPAPEPYALWDRLLADDPSQDVELVRAKRQKLMSIPVNCELGKMIADMVARQLYRRDNLRHFIYSSISFEVMSTQGLSLMCGRELPSDVSACVASHLDPTSIGTLRMVSKRVRAATYDGRLMLSIAEKTQGTASVKAVAALTSLPRSSASILVKSCACDGRGVRGSDMYLAITQSFGQFDRFRRCADARTQSAILRLMDGVDLVEKSYARYFRR
jgi:hypothetical protein